MQTEVYTLPEINFVGGKTQELQFNLKDSNGEPYNASGSKFDFSVCNYSNKIGTPLFSVTPTLILKEDEIMDTINIVIPSDKTSNLYGKFIYQITICDVDGNIEIPNQGIMNITKNINIDFIDSIKGGNNQ